MFGMQTRMTPTPKRVDKAADKGAFKSFSHAAASIRKAAIASIEPSNKPSRPGQPIHTRLSRKKGGRRRRKGAKPAGWAKRSILFKADKDGAVIGFVASKMDQAMSAHEHGKKYKGTLFPKRPTMSPALERSLARFHREWEGAI